MKENYSSFYLSMLCGMAFMFGFTITIEFGGVFNLKWFGAVFFWVFSIILTALWQKELNDAKRDK